MTDEYVDNDPNKETEIIQEPMIRGGKRAKSKGPMQTASDVVMTKAERIEAFIAYLASGYSIGDAYRLSHAPDMSRPLATRHGKELLQEPQIAAATGQAIDKRATQGVVHTNRLRRLLLTRYEHEMIDARTDSGRIIAANSLAKFLGIDSATDSKPAPDNMKAALADRLRGLLASIPRDALKGDASIDIHATITRPNVIDITPTPTIGTVLDDLD